MQGCACFKLVQIIQARVRVRLMLANKKRIVRESHIFSLNYIISALLDSLGMKQNISLSTYTVKQQIVFDPFWIEILLFTLSFRRASEREMIEMSCNPGCFAMFFLTIID